MNLYNFEKQIDKKILDRGYDYYLEENIIDCTFEEPDTYRFDVEGSEDYEVVVQLDENNEIVTSYCDCPYDFGPVCKHEVASYYYLREETDIMQHKKSNRSNKKKHNFEQVIENLSKDELISIIKELTYNNKAIKERILFKYAPVEDGDELKQCEKLVKTIIKKHSGRDGYIDYYHADDFAEEISCVLDKINDIYPNNLLLGLEIAEYLILELIEVEENCDDSDGLIYEVVDNAINIIEDIAEAASTKSIEVQDKVFKKLIKLSKNNKINEIEYHTYDILKSCLYFCDNANLRNVLRSEIEENIKRESNSEYGYYKIEELEKVLFEILKEYGTKEEFENCIRDNIKFTSFREQVIDYYISEGEYNKALRIVIDGEVKDMDNRILLQKWKEYRYDIYIKLNNTVEQEKLGRELLLKGNFKYYEDLKELNKDNFEMFYKEIIKTLKSSRYVSLSNAYINIILKEDDKKEIFEFIKKNPSYIESYIDRVVVDFKDESMELYKKYIIDRAELATNRNMYKNVCDSIKRYKKFFGIENSLEIIDEFMSRYHRRPAFIDELNKVK